METIERGAPTAVRSATFDSPPNARNRRRQAHPSPASSSIHLRARQTNPQQDRSRFDQPDEPRVRRHRRVARLIATLATVAVCMGTAATGQLAGLGSIASVLIATLLGLIIRHVARARDQHPRPRQSHGRTRMHHVPRTTTFAVVTLALGSIAWSYTSYLTAPGAATFAVRTSDWMRDHGMSAQVDSLEQYLYNRNAPGNAPILRTQLPSVPVTTLTKRPANFPARVTPLVTPALSGEGTWKPSTRIVRGLPTAATTFLRPDPIHKNVVAAAVWLNPNATRLVYVPGTKNPGTGHWLWKSGIPVAQRAQLVAAFNSGFQFRDSPGGFSTEGKTPVALENGKASLIIYQDGSVNIGAWGSRQLSTRSVASVRQNLQLIVDNNRVVPGIESDTQHRWGNRKWEVEFTNRSGIGVTHDGALIYVSGRDLTTQTLAAALVRVGAVRAMELDIHATNPTFNFFTPTNATSTSVHGTKLLQDLGGSATRFLAPDQRDFFAVLTR